MTDLHTLAARVMALTGPDAQFALLFIIMLGLAILSRVTGKE